MNGKITVEFQIHHNIELHQKVYVIGDLHHLGAWKTKDAVALSCINGRWIGQLHIPKRQISTQAIVQVLNIQYKYFVASEGLWDEYWEDYNNRHLSIALLGCDQVIVRDIWNSGIEKLPTIQILPPENINASSDSLLQFSSGSEIFLVYGVPSYYGHESHYMKLVGNVDVLGSWELQNGVDMRPYVSVGNTEILWTSKVQFNFETDIQYKYVMVSKRNGGIVWESGENRERHITIGSGTGLCVDTPFRKPENFNTGWAASGYAGLANTFAACSMNSVIQMIYHLPTFKQV